MFSHVTSRLSRRSRLSLLLCGVGLALGSGLVVGQTVVPPSASDDFSVGLELFKAGKMARAAGKFRQSLAVDANNAQAQFYLAESYEALKQSDKARQAYQQAVVLAPSSEAAAWARQRLAGDKSSVVPPVVTVVPRPPAPAASALATPAARVVVPAVAPSPVAASAVVPPLPASAPLAPAPVSAPASAPVSALPIAPAPVAAAPIPAAGTVFRDCVSCPEMVVVPAGSFTMGSSASETGLYESETPAHKVVLAHPFAVGKFEITFEEWNVCVAEHACRPAWDGGWGEGRRPVIHINYEQAVGYTEWLSEKSGKVYRLLTEAEWEYAARAGTDKLRYWGNSTERACLFANVADQSARQKHPDWAETFDCDDAFAQTAPVGSYRPNAFGLYDMLGNVWEWVDDCYHATYQGAPVDGSPRLALDCPLRLYRGGSWYGFPKEVRTALRIKSVPTFSNDDLGLRVARSLP
ncbi:SUMF1/EgtB/PvdO family nonheme iron enzyme [Leptothrix ochracea]|uniref:SUMF1/EgtB/PvdO family nonheme iron enzyme n=1 Tax=Leptothrix ochracea TaxID=735331 RepID=UPI0034E2925B